MEREKVKFYTERNSFGIQTMTVLLALSAVFRIIGCWGLWNDRNYLLLQIVLPVFSALLMIAAIQLFGKRALWVSVIPIALGVTFFIVKSLGFESLLHTILCIILYTAVLALYFCTVFGIVHTKWFLVLIFGLPFLYHIFVEDLTALRDTANPVSFAAGMQEMGVLCIMLGLFFLALSMKKNVTVKQVDLPKIKAPIVLAPKPEKGESISEGTEEPETTTALDSQSFSDKSDSTEGETAEP
ncbi:MAG: hypothetical protein IJK38_00230 [Oscillospiraceae bacterium]|nr:hypothetical protein [Oscillospiraceae bacterium]